MRIIGKRGQVVVLGTDGIWEARNREGLMFGKRRLRRIIRENCDLPAKEIVDLVLEELEAFRRGGGGRGRCDAGGGQDVGAARPGQRPVCPALRLRRRGRRTGGGARAGRWAEFWTGRWAWRWAGRFATPT